MHLLCKIVNFKNVINNISIRKITNICLKASYKSNNKYKFFFSFVKIIDVFHKITYNVVNL